MMRGPRRQGLPPWSAVVSFGLTVGAAVAIASHYAAPLQAHLASVAPALQYLPAVLLPLCVWLTLKLTTLFGGLRV